MENKPGMGQQVPKGFFQKVGLRTIPNVAYRPPPGVRGGGVARGGLGCPAPLQTWTSAGEAHRRSCVICISTPAIVLETLTSTERSKLKM